MEKRMSYFQVNESCNGCLACVQNCPGRALDARDQGDRRILSHNMSRCARCGTCWRVCPQHAVEFQHILANRWDEVVALPLVRCEVCGEAVHTARLPATLEPSLAELAPALCDRHRASRQAAKLRLPTGALS